MGAAVNDTGDNIEEKVVKMGTEQIPTYDTVPIETNKADVHLLLSATPTTIDTRVENVICVKSIADTGASICIISGPCFRWLKTITKSSYDVYPADFSAKVGNGGDLQFAGKVHLTLRLANVMPISLWFHIAEDFPHHIILGNDVMIHYNISVHPAEKCIKIPGQRDVPARVMKESTGDHRVRVRLEEDHELEAHTLNVVWGRPDTIYFTKSGQEEYFLEPCGEGRVPDRKLTVG